MLKGKYSEAVDAAIKATQIKVKAKSADVDALVLKNQIIGYEGVLEYREDDGTVVRKLKRWEDLKENIGRIVPILDEHPDPNNGNDGMFSGNEEIIGFGIIKQYKDTHMLAADMTFTDSAYIKDGYSQGYPYIPVYESGTLNGQKFDMIQSKLKINHIASTNHPRADRAMLLAGDSLKSDLGMLLGADSLVAPGGNGGVLKCAFGYDTVSFDNKRKDEIRAKILADNPDIDPKKLDDLVERMFKNEQKNSRTKSTDSKKGKKMSVDPAATDVDALVKQLSEANSKIAKLEAKKDADAAVAAVKAELEQKLAKAAEREAAAINERDSLLAEQTKSMLATIKARGLDTKDFDGRSRDYIQGAFDTIGKISTGPNIGVPANKETGEDAADIDKIDTSRMHWDDKLQEMVNEDGIPISQINAKGKPMKKGE